MSLYADTRDVFKEHWDSIAEGRAASWIAHYGITRLATYLGVALLGSNWGSLAGFLVVLAYLVREAIQIRNGSKDYVDGALDAGAPALGFIDAL